MNADELHSHVPETLFCLGSIVATQNAIAALTQNDIMRALKRHWSGDWGELEEPDRLENESALVRGGRLFSVYQGENGTRFYVITESDRSVTTILLPEDY